MSMVVVVKDGEKRAAGGEGVSEEERLYECAIGECRAAHEALGERDEQHARLWDCISEVGGSGTRLAGMCDD